MPPKDEDLRERVDAKGTTCASKSGLGLDTEGGALDRDQRPPARRRPRQKHDWRDKHLRACVACGQVWRRRRRRTCPDCGSELSICLTCDRAWPEDKIRKCRYPVEELRRRVGAARPGRGRWRLGAGAGDGRAPPTTGGKADALGWEAGCEDDLYGDFRVRVDFPGPEFGRRALRAVQPVSGGVGCDTDVVASVGSRGLRFNVLDAPALRRSRDRAGSVAAVRTRSLSGPTGDRAAGAGN